MPGSNTPRPAVKSQRTGRPRNIETDIGYDPPDTRSDPSLVIVEGRFYVTAWHPKKRARFNDLRSLAKFFGFSVHESDPSAEVPRRAWTRKRVDLELARLAVVDKPGITFDEWAKLNYADLDDETASSNENAMLAARRKAAVGLSRLWKAGKLVKRVDPKTGIMRLYLPEQGGSK